ncbi:MAG: hypothetical protein R3351_00105, partial [Nitrospirales bacterium]|nr:hypothetical protein [Nitrospirales bacterium]
MATKKGYIGRKLIVEWHNRDEYSWKVSLPKKSWPKDILADVYFLYIEEVDSWEQGSKSCLHIHAGLWQVQKTGEMLVVAPVVGMMPPYEIPPGEYFIAVEWDVKSALTKKPVKIGSDQEFDMFTQEEASKLRSLPPTWQYEKKQNKGRIKYNPEDQEKPTQWKVMDLTTEEEIPPSVPPERPPRRSGGPMDKVDPFVDLMTGIPPFVADISRAKENIWIAWWKLTDDFPVAFGPNRRPSRFLRQEIWDALAANPQLQVYLLIWNLNGGTVKGIDPNLWSRPVDRNRLHISYHANWPLGSHHQKFLLCDLGTSEPNEGAVLWCRGWDGAIT